MTSFRLSKGGLIDRASRLDFSFDGKPYTGFRAIRWPLRFWPMASRSWAARSSITARAASSRQALPNPTRWWNFARAAARKPTPAPP